MDLVNQLAPSFLAGLSGAAALWMWRAVSNRSKTWYPLFRRVTGLMLWAWVLGSAAAISIQVLGATDAKGPLAGVIAGFCAPTILSLLSRRRGSGGGTTRAPAGIASTSELNRAVKSSRQPARLDIGGAKVPFRAEPGHFLVAGSPGADQPVAISSMLEQLRKAGDTVVVVDGGGRYLSRHFNADSDFVINPFDNRCVDWSPLFEIREDWDADAIARGLVPDGAGETRERDTGAQSFVGAVLRQLWLKKDLKLGSFLFYIQTASVADLRIFLQGTGAQALLSSEATFGPVRALAINCTQALKYLPENGTPFSVSEMIRAEHSGFLYLTYRNDQLETLRNLLAAILDVAVRAIQSLGPDSQRRVWVVVDDVAALGRLKALEVLTTQGGSAGGCLVIGMPSVTQMRERYGELATQTLLSSVANWLVLGSADSTTAEYLSRYIGDVVRQREDASRGDKDKEKGKSAERAPESVIERAVTAVQIQKLKPLTGFLRLPDELPITQVSFPKQKKGAVQRAEAVVERNFEARPQVTLPERSPLPTSTAKYRVDAMPSTERAHAQTDRAEVVVPPAPVVVPTMASSIVPEMSIVAPVESPTLTPSLVDDGQDLPSDSRVLVRRGLETPRVEIPRVQIETPAAPESGLGLRRKSTNQSLRF